MIEYSDIRMIGDAANVRYALYKWGARNLLVIGLNPSTANESTPDPTMRRVMGTLRKGGYDGFCMLNLYPQRATRPVDLHPQADAALIDENVKVLEQMLRENAELSERTDILLAFGEKIMMRPYLKESLLQIYEAAEPFQPQWLCMATTQYGHPRHPLYLPGNLLPQPFDIEDYFQRLFRLRSRSYDPHMCLYGVPFPDIY